MKKMNLFLIASLMLACVSCGNKQKNESLFYEVILSEKEDSHFMALTLKNSKDEYLLFDDEFDYSEFVGNLYMTCRIAEILIDRGYTKEEVEGVLMYLTEWPIKHNYFSQEIKEICNRVYYDENDALMYNVKESYGEKKFEIDLNPEYMWAYYLGLTRLGTEKKICLKSSLTIFGRDEDCKILDKVPAGALVIMLHKGYK